MSSSESERDSSDSEDHDLRVMEAIKENQSTIHLAASFLSWYYASYNDKNECKTPTYPGLAWVMDALDDPKNVMKSSECHHGCSTNYMMNWFVILA
jgi:hypothetical protein